MRTTIEKNAKDENMDGIRVVTIEDYVRKAQYSAEETINKSEGFVDEMVGVIKNIHTLLLEPDDPKFFYVGAIVADTSRYLRFKCGINTSGVGLTEKIAKAAAIGESIERYCCGIYDREELILSSWKELKERGCEATHPKDFALFSERQYSQKNFPYRKFTENTKLEWAWGYSLFQKKSVLVPACLIYIPFVPSSEERGIGYSVSTGLACARSVEEAILKGIFEIVERDAIMIMWLNRLSMPRVCVSSSKFLNQVQMERLQPSGAKWHLVDVTTDVGIPAMLALAIDETNDGYAAAVGSAANLSSEAAALRALMEAAQTRIWAKYLSRQYTDQDFESRHWEKYTVVGFEEHVHLYGKLKMLPHLKFVYSSPVVMDIKEIPDESTGEAKKDLQICLEKLGGKASDVIIVDHTTPDCEELGFRVIRTLIPNFQGMTIGQSYLGGNRLYDIPKVLGYRKRKTSEKHLNHLPHPFP